MIQGLKNIASDRKGILYLCGGCRFIWDLLYDDWSKIAVEVAERFADGHATREELEQANQAAECPTFGIDFEPRVWRQWSTDGNVPSSVQRLVEMGILSERQLEEDEPEVDPIRKSRLLAAANLAYGACTPNPLNSDWFHPYLPQVDWPGDWLPRCVFGKPFLPAVTIDSRWLTTDVDALARTIYDNRAFDLMPILGDALEDAGCNNADIFAHCRRPGEHVRGCWVVDILLGKS